MKFLITILFVLPLSMYGQTMIFGTVIDRSSQQPIPYATVGFIKKNAGTNADEKGKFILEVNLGDPDTLLVSSIGYESLKVSVMDARANATIALEKKVRSLPPVTLISKENWQYATINKPEHGITGITSAGYVTQMGQLLTAPEANCQLMEVDIYLNVILFETRKAKFRLRIYQPDSITGMPTNELCDEPIDVDADSKLVKIDLSDRKIFIPGTQFILAIEWLKIPYNEENRGPKDQKVTTYRPSICFKHDGDKTSRVWMLTYKGDWVVTWGNVLAIGGRVRW